MNPRSRFARGAGRTISPWITPIPRRANMRRRPGKAGTIASRRNVVAFEEEFKMPKAVTEIRSLARSHTRTALNVLVAVMRNTKATPPARVAAANALLDRGWGKPTQAIGNDESALELIHRIERVIVHPENVHAENPDR
jgi:hypothetical protein